MNPIDALASMFPDPVRKAVLARSGYPVYPGRLSPAATQRLCHLLSLWNGIPVPPTAVQDIADATGGHRPLATDGPAEMMRVLHAIIATDDLSHLFPPIGVKLRPTKSTPTTRVTPSQTARPMAPKASPNPSLPRPSVSPPP